MYKFVNKLYDKLVMKFNFSVWVSRKFLGAFEFPKF